MDEQKNAGQPQEKTPKEVPPSAPPPIDPPQAPPNPGPEEGDRGDEPRKSSTISDKVMVFATCVIAAGTLVSAGAIVLQWKEMVKGGADTTALVGYAQRQADDADKMRLSADKQAGASQQFADTASLINGNINDAVSKLNLQADKTQSLMEQVKRQSDLAEKQFSLVDRPWVGTDGDVGYEIRPQPNGITFRRANYTIKNFGSGPAFNVVFDMEPLFFSPPKLNDGEIENAVERMCTKAEQDLRTGRRTALLLPNSRTPNEWSLNDQYGEGFVVLPGCIAYADIDGGIHHTGTCHIIGLFTWSPTQTRWDTCAGHIAN
jgi:hypothetical protein